MTRTPLDSSCRVEDSMNTTLSTAIPPTDRDVEKNSPAEKLILSEKQAIQHARASPNDRRPVYICFGPNDKDNPRCWSKRRKWYISAFASWLNILFSASISDISLGFEQISKDLHVSLEVVTLAGLTMHCLGAGIGILFWGPLSERYGRRPIAIVSQFLLFIFQLPAALAPNIGTLIVFRFLQGFGGTAPGSNTGGTIHDLWIRDESGPALSSYAISTVTSPGLTLVATGYLIQNKGWRWVFWVMMAVFGAFLLLIILTIPETRHSIILKNKAKRVRKVLRKEGLNHEIYDETADQRNDLSSLFKITLTRPIRFLFTEPIVIFSSIYNGYLFGIVFIFQGSFNQVFGKPSGHDFNIGETGLTFAGLMIGTLVGAALNPIQDLYYRRRLKEAGKGVPEARMWMARWGSFLFPISLFWFGWTSYKTVHWIVPIIASGFFGLGFYIILMAILSYVYDSYGSYYASALGGVLLVRNLAGTFPLFGYQMYEYLGNEWATSLLGFLSLLLIPIPFVYFHKGETLRWRSAWAREHFDQKDD